MHYLDVPPENNYTRVLKFFKFSFIFMFCYISYSCIYTCDYLRLFYVLMYSTKRTLKHQPKAKC